MPNRDLYNCTNEQESVRPAVHATDATGEACDLRGADSAMFVASIGAIVGTADDASIIIQESDASASGYTAVADADLHGTEPTALEPNTSHRIGYKGAKRYVRAVLDVGTETSVAGAIICVTGHLSRKPEDASYAS